VIHRISTGCPLDWSCLNVAHLQDHSIHAFVDRLSGVYYLDILRLLDFNEIMGCLTAHNLDLTENKNFELMMNCEGLPD